MVSLLEICQEFVHRLEHSVDLANTRYRPLMTEAHLGAESVGKTCEATCGEIGQEIGVFVYPRLKFDDDSSTFPTATDGTPMF